jgi:DNA-binding transcriptional MerR regulator
MRIGALSRRTGVPPELLRAWERRYGLFEPARSDGGYRLYSDADVERLRAMQAHLASGLSAAEAAGLALAEGTGRVDQPEQQEKAGGPERPVELLAELRVALDRFDDGAAHTVVDRALASLTTDAVLTELVLPYLAELGARWERGQVSVAHEHFASNLLRGRLLGLARGWDRGAGPRAVLAAAPGELHDLPLIVFGLALRSRGWRITYLGADTPLATAADAVRELRPQLLAVSATDSERLDPYEDVLGRIAKDVELGLAGAGASAMLADRVGARYLPGDPVTEAERLTAELPHPVWA